VLKLDENNLAGEGAEALASALNRNTSLEELHVSNTSIGDEGNCFLHVAPPPLPAPPPNFHHPCTPSPPPLFYTFQLLPITILPLRQAKSHMQCVSHTPFVAPDARNSSKRHTSYWLHWGTYPFWRTLPPILWPLSDPPPPFSKQYAPCMLKELSIESRIKGPR